MTNASEQWNADTLLLTTLMDLVPNAAITTEFVAKLNEMGLPDLANLLKGYGTLLNVIQSASEDEGDLHERLSAGYYALTNQDPAANE